VSRPSKQANAKRPQGRHVKVGSIECKPSRARPAVAARLLASRTNLLRGLTRDADIALVRWVQLAK